MKSNHAIGAALGVIVCFELCGIAGAQEPLRDAPLRAFDATQLTPDRYTVVKRLWVDSWRTVFDVPTHPESSAALAQLSEEAVKLGADALVNVICLNDDRVSGKGSYFCHALAVKLK